MDCLMGWGVVWGQGLLLSLIAYFFLRAGRAPKWGYLLLLLLFKAGLSFGGSYLALGVWHADPRAFVLGAVLGLSMVAALSFLCLTRWRRTVKPVS